MAMLQRPAIKVKNTFLEYYGETSDVQTDSLTNRRSSSAPPRVDVAWRTWDNISEKQLDSDANEFPVRGCSTDSLASTISSSCHLQGDNLYESFTPSTSEAYASSCSLTSISGCGSSFENVLEAVDSNAKVCFMLPPVSVGPGGFPGAAKTQHPGEEDSTQASDDTGSQPGTEDAQKNPRRLWKWMIPSKKTKRKSDSLITRAWQAQRQQRQQQLQKLHDPQETQEPEKLSPCYPNLSEAAVPEQLIASAISACAAVQNRLAAHVREGEIASASAASAASQNRLAAHAREGEKGENTPKGKKDRRAKFCTSCGGAVIEKAKFCRFCGSSVSSMP